MHITRKMYMNESVKGIRNHLVMSLCLKQYLAVTNDIIIRVIKLGITKKFNISNKTLVKEGI